MSKPEIARDTLRRPGNGGARPGSGRKPLNTERFEFRCSRDIRILLFRFAALKGISLKDKNNRISWGGWDKLLTELLSKHELPKPAYLELVAKR